MVLIVHELHIETQGAESSTRFLKLLGLILICLWSTVIILTWLTNVSLVFTCPKLFLLVPDFRQLTGKT